MIPWELLGRGAVGGGESTLCLYRRGGEFSMRMSGREVMNSTRHGSEEALSELVCARVARRPSGMRLLVGGLGFGFTLAAALRRIGARDRVDVAEWVPEVVAWNHGVLSPLAGHPLSDRRVRVVEEDVARILREGRNAYDAILLDVDNGPGRLLCSGNGWLYTLEGVRAASSALRPQGVLGVWSEGGDAAFPRRLRRAGFSVEEMEVPARGCGKGGRHVVWVAVRR